MPSAGIAAYRDDVPVILLVEDDRAVRTALIHALTERRFAVVPAENALTALRSIAEQVPDIVILDLGLPDLDGATVLRMIRGMTDVPVIVATARGDERSVVSLLDAGADDYVVKPVSSENLMARISALLRRTNAVAERHDGPFDVGGLHVEPKQRIVRLEGRQLVLNRLEFALLNYLAARPDTVVSRQELAREVWHKPEAVDQTIDVHVSRVRHKLRETAANPRYLHTVRGIGFKLTAPT